MSEDAVSVLGRLVAIPSVNPAFRLPSDDGSRFGEFSVAHAVAEWLKMAGLEVSMEDVAPRRPNVVARLRGRNASRRQLWEGHLDTVQVTGMTIEPFSSLVLEGRLYGRGAVDDKGCLAAFMLALRELALDPDGLDITFVAAADEEVHQTGVLHHLKQGRHYDGGIAGEPTELRVVSASKGCVRWDIEITGRPAHSSRPLDGVDAVAIGTELALHLRRKFTPLLALRSHRLVGGATMVCTRIDGGEGLNTVPARCLLKFDRRTLPGESNAHAWEEVAAEVAAFARTIPAGASIVTQPPFIDCPAMEAQEASGIVSAARAACRGEGLPDAVLGVPYGSDASRMADFGIPTIIFGPGSIEQAHTADEFVEIAQVERAARILCEIAHRFAAT